ncbi:MAG: FmdB family zinc ribbon protein [Aggregatilineales bacterium]
MPVYEYACESCKERFEIKQKFTDNPLTICPRCSGSIHRVMQPMRVVFKGSGFYVTDHNKSSVQSAKSDSKPASENGDAKPANGESSSTANTPGAAEPAKPEPSVSS